MDFFYLTGSLRAKTLIANERAKGKELGLSDEIFWTRMYSLTLAKSARGSGHVTIEEYQRIQRTTQLVAQEMMEGATKTAKGPPAVHMAASICPDS